MLQYLVIVLALAVLGLLMAKHGRANRRSFQVGQLDAALSLGTLANADLISGDLFSGDVVDDDTYMISTKLSWGIDDLTDGQGPILVGIAHGDYTDAEIEEWIEASNSLGSGNMIEKERSRRKCRRVGMFSGSGPVETLNDGKPISTKLRFMLSTGQNLKFWAYNKSGSSLSTTVPVVRINGPIFMRSN